MTVRVNTTKVDPFYYNPLWDEEKPVTFLFRFTFNFFSLTIYVEIESAQIDEGEQRNKTRKIYFEDNLL